MSYWTGKELNRRMPLADSITPETLSYQRMKPSE